jgi:lambda family phage minor tail protein L
MAAEGKNKVASSLLDLQPTAILELFRVYPDRINKPNLYLGFHGGALFDKAIVWQNTQYLPLAIESEGFDMLADGKLARPKIKVANKNNIVTNFLQNYKDFINAKVIRKKVSVKYLDDSNFDGGNPFGVADPTAELLNEEWVMGRKTQESKVFVEFELNSPLDLENFTVNNRGIVAKFCYWQYRGEGCRYAGFPIEKDDGTTFLDPTGGRVVPQWPSSYTDPSSATDFFADPTTEWQETGRTYVKGDIVQVTSPSITITSQTDPNNGVPLKTVYVCVSGNSAQPPEGNPTYWQKDGCTKKFPACQKRFNPLKNLAFPSAQEQPTGFSGIKLFGAESQEEAFHLNPINSGVFHSTVSGLTGVMTGNFTLVGWANITQNSPLGAGVFTTSSRDDGFWPQMRFINLGVGSAPGPFGEEGEDNRGTSAWQIYAEHLGFKLAADGPNPDIERTEQGHPDNTVSLVTDAFGRLQGPESPNREWRQYIIANSTLTQTFIDAVKADDNIAEGEAKDRFIESGGYPHLDTYFTTRERFGTNDSLGLGDINFLGNEDREFGFTDGIQNAWPMDGNFASVEKRQAMTWGGNNRAGTITRALPQTFMLGASENQYGTLGYEENAVGYLSTMNGCLGPWALWSRRLSEAELNYLYKTIVAPVGVINNFDVVPRQYYECTGEFASITGNGLVAWWDGTTGQIPGHPTTLGMLDISHNDYHLTGSGLFEGFEETYGESQIVFVENPYYPYPRYGGYPGTDGFSYGRNASI